MRLSEPVLPSLNWLSSLKAVQLQRVAFLTGVSSSGTKPVLIERLTKVLSSSSSSAAPPPPPTLQARSRAKTGRQNSSVSGSGNDGGGRLSILSIDMGIRNLAYAHLLVYPESRRRGRSDGQKFTSLQSPILNVWNRLAISEFPSPSAAEAVDLSAPLAVLGGAVGNGGEKLKLARCDSSQPEEQQVGGTKSTVEKESFAPDLYASHAYTLITSLVATYQPTHILIERQRFRSGGGSAVQEWTIRVGVFEGMLYAVLHTLQREPSKVGLDIAVQGVEPQRVARYWIERDSGTPEEAKGRKTKKKTTSKEGKKAKIDLVGRWISSSAGAAKAEGPAKVEIAANGQAKGMAMAFLRKWSKGRTGSGRTTAAEHLLSASCAKRAPRRSAKAKGASADLDHDPDTVVDRQVGPVDIGKLDDLADCLLQGIAWLEWQGMREKIAAEGIDAVPGI
ncbi:hypothetical protein PRK78_000883 [Emydomyces testavorans]|uniref:SAP domain-containing protein n=1 Tax=Emydomyces testavorans TaxID=2070801 RepID=A0AAF0IG35_9EURO|nr:hypothetical protein PRK78_000883 [Emydomyces testavorans]